jgi:threonine dehydrogenase-like Zn-dependent dehydrogenase
VQLSSSQVSRIAPALSARWDRARRFATAWRALAALDPGPLITHRFALGEAPAAYELLDRSPERALQVLLLS